GAEQAPQGAGSGQGQDQHRSGQGGRRQRFRVAGARSGHRQGHQARYENFPADERHIREIVSLTRDSRGSAGACVAALSRRLGRTRSWDVALKTLVIVHRLLAEGDPVFEQELFYATRRGTRMLNMSDFCGRASDDDAWDYSAFVRTYAAYLDDRLEHRIQARQGGPNRCKLLRDELYMSPGDRFSREGVDGSSQGGGDRAEGDADERDVAGAAPRQGPTTAASPRPIHRLPTRRRGEDEPGGDGVSVPDGEGERSTVLRAHGGHGRAHGAVPGHGERGLRARDRSLLRPRQADRGSRLFLLVVQGRLRLPPVRRAGGGGHHAGEARAHGRVHLRQARHRVCAEAAAAVAGAVQPGARGRGVRHERHQGPSGARGAAGCRGAGAGCQRDGAC
uniref:ENTH domain-containing protein n=1 Tax=Aegilops tauschii subsp. strangulata TaxID=200361 RepID=A0A452Z658_AEGTS